MPRKKVYNQNSKITRHCGHMTSNGLTQYFSKEDNINPFIIDSTLFKQETGMGIPDEITTLNDKLISCKYNDKKLKISYLGLRIKKEIQDKKNMYDNGKPKKAQIARIVGCSEPTIKYYIDPREKIRIQECHKETKKVLKEIAEDPEIQLNAYGRRAKKDPDTIFTKKSIGKIGMINK